MQEQSQQQFQSIVSGKSRPPSPRRRRARVPAWFRAARRGRSGNDDDPPPSPAVIAAPALLAWHDAGRDVAGGDFGYRLAA